jgi:hypothetical protein
VAGTDYTQTSGTLVFPAGVTSETVAVPITTVLMGGPTKRLPAKWAEWIAMAQVASQQGFASKSCDARPAQEAGYVSIMGKVDKVAGLTA